MISLTNQNNYNKLMQAINDTSPYMLKEGVFGANVKNDLFLRMELITEDNTDYWNQFKNWSCKAAHADMGLFVNLSELIVNQGDPPNYDIIKNATGFTEDEYDLFIEKAKKLKKQALTALNSNTVGTTHLYIKHGESCYMVYATKDRNFSIQNSDMTGKKFTLKNFIEAYKDILISVGANFSFKDSFSVRGISRNPYWVFEQQNSGLSMLLIAFIGAVAAKFFPEKEEMQVTPIHSMQCVLKKHILPGEGFARVNEENIDLTKFERSVLETPFLIKTSALKRIYELES